MDEKEIKNDRSYNDIYKPDFVKNLFNSMSSTYGITNYISSFGFTERWRKACIQQIPAIASTDRIYDLMSGMGELWVSIKAKSNTFKEIVAVDISPHMNGIARKNLVKVEGSVSILEQDILNNNIPSNSADIMVSSFGLKTFNANQTERLAKEIARILKPGGYFSFVEISVPPNSFLRSFYLFYLKRIIPVIGYLFQGNSSDYKMLGIYTSLFGSCRHFNKSMIAAGLQSNYKDLFFGCASLVYGIKQ